MEGKAISAAERPGAKVAGDELDARPGHWRLDLTPMARLGGAIVLVVVLLALLAPLLAPHDYKEQQLSKALVPPFWELGADPAYPLGTDHLGRDMLSRILYGARTSLLVGLGGVAIAGGTGVTLGLLAGFYGRWVDDLIMRLVDVQLSFPPIFLVIAIMAVIG